MLVNGSQISFVLGISPAKAKRIIIEHIFYNKKDAKVKNKDVFESSLLKQVFHHPSIELDGKDIIEFTIKSLNKSVGDSLKKKILEDQKCLKNAKICGKYAVLLQILNEDDIESITAILKRRRSEFIQSGGKFKIKTK